MNGYLKVEHSTKLHGKVSLIGAKNAVLVIMASLILTEGKSKLNNVPASDDIMQMMQLLRDLGAEVSFNKETHTLEIDTTLLVHCQVKKEIMKQMRASILVMGPLLARFGKANIALPGGCIIGARPINYHLNNLRKMGASIQVEGEYLFAHAKKLKSQRIVLEYPSVGATENIVMAAVAAQGTTRIINASLEPEVLDLIAVLKKMGAQIVIEPPATIAIEGGASLKPIEHTIMYDRLEAGSLLLAAAITGGKIELPHAPAYNLDVFLLKLQEMGHYVEVGSEGVGVTLKATHSPKAVSFKTAPYPGFPTDLQAPMMVAQCLASGTSIIDETVFENRLLHVHELQKMGAQIKVDGSRATVIGVDELYGAPVIASDIRGGCALLIAGLAAKGITTISGVYHLSRGYESIQKKLTDLGASIEYVDAAMFSHHNYGRIIEYQ
jgi:UDP-N-acetylglucosamine 1-carboxyvinyltransferase